MALSFMQTLQQCRHIFRQCKDDNNMLDSHKLWLFIMCYGNLVKLWNASSKSQMYRLRVKNLAVPFFLHSLLLVNYMLNVYILVTYSSSPEPLLKLSQPNNNHNPNNCSCCKHFFMFFLECRRIPVTHSSTNTTNTHISYVDISTQSSARTPWLDIVYHNTEKNRLSWSLFFNFPPSTHPSTHPCRKVSKWPNTAKPRKAKLIRSMDE